MSLYKARRSSLRQSLAFKIIPRKTLISPDKLKGRYLFRSAVRRVLEYMEWITEKPIVEEISDDVTINIRMTQERKVEKKLLTLKDRSILLVKPIERSSEDKAYIYDLITKFRGFMKHPEQLRKNLAAVCFYQYLSAGRGIVRQGRKAENLYFIMNGEVSLSKVAIDELTGEEKVVDMGTMQPGDMFGEIALLHRIPRTATIVTNTPVDLLLISQNDFDNVLRGSLTKKWDVLRDALVHFNYFKLWDEETVRECCILSKLKDFKPNEKSVEPEDEVDRVSIVTTTLFDVVKGWHEITDIAAILMREPSVTSELNYPSDVRTIFMQICTFSRGACFGIGEKMLHRRIVAITPVRCFLVPRYWLLEHNRANIWGRVKLFMDLKYPTRKQLFEKFLLNRKWMTYKQNLVKDVINRRGHFRSNTTIHDVPYSIRITDEIDPKL
ncbi:PREDICTED: uncharacterized protein LOC105456180 isoform X3 [Wasmannia auropunctata]|uniref:uncharacterized protein LOC105456180 isoform X3 n=1 Tax=Wasmannia auropunctata TaxID=64793 RepID=UPI0005EECFEB|nr:PREDICTED: uncharacterized protein LOC105456180 isoform X3 [Wasmannia auropunctata]